MRHKNEALRGELLACARTMLNENGPESITMRALAKNAGVAAGTLYNYFADKDALLLALAGEFWQSVLCEISGIPQDAPFDAQLADIYALLWLRIQDFRGSLLGGLRAMSHTKEDSREREKGMQDRLAAELAGRLCADASIPARAWADGCTPDSMAAFLMTNLLALLMQGAQSPDFLRMITRRTLLLEENT